MDAEWWDIVNAIAQSVGALGTMGALIVAVVTYRRQLAEQRRRNARMVHVWQEQNRMHLHNLSDQPIFQVHPALLYWPRHAPNKAGDVSIIAGAFVVDFPATEEGRQGLLERRRVAPDVEITSVMREPSVPPFLAGWLFTDADGRRWVRVTKTGELIPVEIQSSARFERALRQLDHLLAWSERRKFRRR